MKRSQKTRASAGAHPADPALQPPQRAPPVSTDPDHGVPAIPGDPHLPGPPGTGMLGKGRAH